MAALSCRVAERQRIFYRLTKPAAPHIRPWHMERLTLIISGRVQGVFFRAHTQDTAIALGITGFVRNTEDGGVEVTAEGSRSQLSRFLEWCRKGPPMARVMSIDERWETATGEFREFRIAY